MLLAAESEGVLSLVPPDSDRTPGATVK